MTSLTNDLNCQKNYFVTINEMILMEFYGIMWVIKKKETGLTIKEINKGWKGGV